VYSVTYCTAKASGKSEKKQKKNGKLFKKTVKKLGGGELLAAAIIK
jgi:hypothetical protein